MTVNVPGVATHDGRGRALTTNLALSVLAVYALVSVGQVYVAIEAGADRSLPWWAPGLMVLLRIAYLAALTPLVLLIGRRYRIEAPYVLGRAALHIVIVSIAAPGYAAAILVSRWIVLGATEATLWGVLINRVDDVVLYYAVLLAISYAVDYYTEARARELTSAQLRYEMLQAQLVALRTQLQPHFLFNTLNGITELVHQDPDRADLMIGRLGELLRRSLEQGDVQSVPLETELDTVRLYVSIQQVRYPHELTVDYQVAPDVLQASVPVFLLQPLVENAIRHGIGNRIGNGRVTIAATREAGQLVIDVIDNGPGVFAHETVVEGIGLQNVRARLYHMYGAAAVLELRPAGPAGGAHARVVLPFIRTAAPPRRSPSDLQERVAH